jgi:hypothetical protein
VIFKLKWIMNASVIAMAIYCGVPSAEAEQISFDLAVEAHWGTIILQPGHYSLEVPSAASWPQRICVTQNGKRHCISPLVEEVAEESQRSYLRLVTVGSEYFVREYDSGPTGKRFTFRVPKATSDEADATRSSIAVPETGGN